MPTLSINPKTPLTGDAAKEFFDFLTQQKQQNVSFFKKGYTPYFHTNIISFEQDVICEDLNPQGTYTCNFMGKKLGEGTYATVYNIDESMTASNIAFSPSGYKQPHVVKIQHHCLCNGGTCLKHNPLRLLENEYQMSLKATHLDIHSALFSHANMVSYTIMNKLPGVELFQVISKDWEKNSSLTLQQRLELSLVLLESAKKQITDLNMIHFDIKPENVMVDMSTTPITLNFLDFAFGQQIPMGEKGIITDKHGGSKGYAAPEVMLSPSAYLATPAADLFSLMKILMLIWGMVDSSYDDSPLSVYKLYLRKPQKLDKLFSHIPADQRVLLCQLGLDILIKASLTKGLARNPAERGTIDEAILTYQQFLELYKQSLQRRPLNSIASSQQGEPLKVKELRLSSASSGSIPVPYCALFQPAPLNLTKDKIENFPRV